MTAHGDVLTLSGTAISLKEPLTAFVGEGTTVKALDIASNVSTANTNALSALDGLSVNSDTQSILDAMNMQIINFASGSAQIPAINQTVLKKRLFCCKAKPMDLKLQGMRTILVTKQTTSNCPKHAPKPYVIF